MVEYKIEGCVAQDGTAMAQNNIPAFWEDVNWNYSWRHYTLERLVRATELRYPRRQLLKNRDTLRHFKALDPKTGKLVGYIRWELPLQHCKDDDGNVVWPEGQVPAVSIEEEEAFNVQAESVDWQPMEFDGDDLDKKLRERMNELLTEKECIVLDYLAVHPDQQGKGIGTVLVKHGIQKAHQMGINIIVMAFSSGFKVYKNTGFKLLESIVQDATPFGGNDEYAVQFMEYEVVV